MRGGWLPWISGLAIATAAGCRSRAPAIEAPFEDDFDRAELGTAWNATSPAYRLEAGQLEVMGAYNHPAWLERRLPPSAIIDFDVMSKSPAGDIKVELYGDGKSFDPDKGNYDSTGYVVIFGGWHNSLSVICRLEEHGAGRKAERADVRVEPGRRYHFTIAREGGTPQGGRAEGGKIDWKLDGQPFLSWTDPDPLGGSGHEYFAVNDWEADVAFDNLTIRSAP